MELVENGVKRVNPPNSCLVRSLFYVLGRGDFVIERSTQMHEKPEPFTKHSCGNYRCFLCGGGGRERC